MDEYINDIRYALEKVNKDLAIKLCYRFVGMIYAAAAADEFKERRREQTALDKAQRTASGLAHNQRLHEEAAQRRRVAQWRKAVQQARLARQRGEHVPPPAPPAAGLTDDDKAMHNRFVEHWNARNPHEPINFLP